MIRQLLIANRGEIACRIIQTARKMAINTIIVYEQADQNTKAVALADQAYRICSYFNREEIVKLATAKRADAIHPGYGLLAEDSEFAAQCQQAGILFIGPSADIIQKMADKSQAKRIMQGLNVPIIPGYQGDKQSLANLQQQADRIGYPLLVKATHSGGGKGIRQVKQTQEFASALAQTQREIPNGISKQILLEKYINPARHIEIQIARDQFGHCVHLFSRDCSLQRRHQKIIEEAPARNLTDQCLDKMTSIAVDAANALNYHGVGTFEFLVDQDQQYYFMEMNTRLQVEHAVTEMITSIDLVAWQLLIADGQPLPLSQQAITYKGHAIEVRICAENPLKECMPTCGKLKHLQLPDASQQVRIDSGIRAGDLISPHYDSLLAKLIVWGQTRQAAINKLIQQLETTYLLGVTNNIGFIHHLICQEDFFKLKINTDFIKQHPFVAPKPKPLVLQAAAYAEQQWRKQQQEQNRQCSEDHHSPWHYRDAWQLGKVSNHYLECWYQEQHYRIDLRAKIDTHVEQATTFHNTNVIDVFYQGNHYPLQCSRLHKQQQTPSKTKNTITACMPSTVIDIAVKQGQSVAKDQIILVLEAMKLQQTIKSPHNATIKKIHCSVGDLVKEAQLLIELNLSSA